MNAEEGSSKGAASAAAAYSTGSDVSHRLVGHAIVSADDKIADADGRFPDSLKNERDWALFQAALDAADLSLIGRESHEAAPNVKGRRRLVVSSKAEGLEKRDDAWWVNPEQIPLGEALAQLLPHGGDVAVPGGKGVFDLCLAYGFRAFHLVRAPVRLPGGRWLFSACETGLSAETVLSGAGLARGETEIIDPAAGVTRTIWSRSQ